MSRLRPTTNPDDHAGLARPVEGCNCLACKVTALKLGPTAPAPTRPKASDLDGKLAEAAKRYRQAGDHDAQARAIERQVNGLLADRMAHVQAAEALRSEADAIMPGFKRRRPR